MLYEDIYYRSYFEFKDFKMKLYLIRHAKSIANEMQVYSGSTDISLTQEGIEKIEQLKQEAIYPNVKDIDVFYTSELKRTKQTLNIIYPNVAYKSIKELNEVDFGMYEMKFYKDVEHYKHYIEWHKRERFTMLDSPEGENVEMVLARIYTAFYNIFAEMKEQSYNSAAIVIHGAIMSIIMEHFYKLTEGYNSWLPTNGRGYMVEFADNDIANIKSVDDVANIKIIGYQDI